MTAIIEVERLTKSYGGKRGIVDVSFEVDGGRGVRVPRAPTVPARRPRSAC